MVQTGGLCRVGGQSVLKLEGGISAGRGWFLRNAVHPWKFGVLRYNRRSEGKNSSNVHSK